MLVAPPQQSEFPRLQELVEACGLSFDLREELSLAMTRLWVARPSAEAPIEAFLLVYAAADERHVVAIGTRPEVRRRGYARRLLVELIDHARSQAVRLVLLEVRRSNGPAIALYRSFGFGLARLRSGYYSNPCEDGIEMMLTLSPSGQILAPEHEFTLPEA